MDKSLIRLFLLLSLCVPVQGQLLAGVLNPESSPAIPTASYVTGCGNFNNGIVGTLACTINGVTAGDAIVVCQTSVTDPTATIATVSDGTSSFADGATGGTANTWGQCHWLLSANAGNKTYTVSFSANALAPVMWAEEFHASSGTWHIDTGNQAGGIGTAVATGAITTAHSTGEAIVFTSSLSNFVATASGMSIGGHTPTEATGSPVNTYQRAFYLLNTSVTAGQGTLTYSTSTDWAANLIALYAQ